MGTGDRIRFFIEYALLRGLFVLLGRIPRRPGAAVGRGLGRAVGAVARRRTRLAQTNMAAAFPDAGGETIRSWTAAMWSELGAGAYEFARLGRLTQDRFRREVNVVGLDHLSHACSLGRGVVLVTGHLGNWEYTSWATAIYSGRPTAVVARRMKNPFVNEWITALRARSGCDVLMHKNAVREAVRRLSRGELVGLLFDQRITAGGVKAPFFGRPAHTTGMPAVLALRFGCPILPVRSSRHNGVLTVEVEPAIIVDGPATAERIEEVTCRLNGVLERWVKERPEQWLWIHDRWKD